MACYYCKLSLDYDKFKDHVTACGSRTELCTDCKKYILIKDLNKHLENNCFQIKSKDTPFGNDYRNSKTTRPQSSLVIFPCEFCNEQFVGFQELIQHQVVKKNIFCFYNLTLTLD